MSNGSHSQRNFTRTNLKVENTTPENQWKFLSTLRDSSIYAYVFNVKVLEDLLFTVGFYICKYARFFLFIREISDSIFIPFVPFIKINHHTSRNFFISTFFSKHLRILFFYCVCFVRIFSLQILTPTH